MKKSQYINCFNKDEVSNWKKLLASTDSIDTFKENLTVEKTKLEKQNEKFNKRKTYGFLLGLSMVGLWFGSFDFLKINGLDNVFLVAIAVYFILGLIYAVCLDVMGINNDARISINENFLEELKPITRSSSSVDDALSLIQESKACQEHQKTVLEAKRGFLIADLKLMASLRKEEIEEEKNNLLYQKPKVEINEYNFQIEREIMAEKL